MTPTFDTPRLLVAGLSGGAGKTIVSLGLCRALADAGVSVKPCKKGPDYIDAAWLGQAARHPATNLDAHLMGGHGRDGWEAMAALFADAVQGFDLSLIEANRGLFDGMDADGTLSSAQVARRLAAPVVLVLDATKTTRTAAAVLQGVTGFEPGLDFAGVILNRVAGQRHEAVLVQSIERYTDLAVLGVLGKMAVNPIPERHMGLTSDREMEDMESGLGDLGRRMAGCVDLDALRRAASAAGTAADPGIGLWPARVTGEKPRIGMVVDAALWFYYAETREALERAGAEVVELGILDRAPWPEIHGLYLGGGFPEVQARRIAANTGIREHVLALSRGWLPIYAECGGFMFLCRELVSGLERHAMAGVFDTTTRLCARPQGLGYTEGRVVAANPFYPSGSVLMGHEFHYSCCETGGAGREGTYALAMERGKGMSGGADGLLVRNTWGSYFHMHPLGGSGWAGNFVRAAAAYQAGRRGPVTAGPPAGEGTGSGAPLEEAPDQGCAW